MVVVSIAGGEVDTIRFEEVKDICLSSSGWYIVGHYLGWLSSCLDELSVAELARCNLASTCCIISSIRSIYSSHWQNLSSIA